MAGGAVARNRQAIGNIFNMAVEGNGRYPIHPDGSALPIFQKQIQYCPIAHGRWAGGGAQAEERRHVEAPGVADLVYG